MFRLTVLPTLLMLCFLASPAHAGIICSSPALPPACGAYRTPAQVHADYAAGMFVLSDISHFGFLNVVITPMGADERETFDSTVTGTMTITPPGSSMPILMTGQVIVLTHGKTGNTTGTFDTEMLAMNLSGGGALVRESPTLPSLGRTTITDQGGGLYRIDSFFDVFTELSLDGGQTWLPSSGSTLVELVPEPSSLFLIALGGFVLPFLRRRRRS